MKLKWLSLAFTLALMAIALWVFIGKANGEDMWIPIAGYWAVLSLKYLVELTFTSKPKGNP